jgi:hypothetical protein
MPKLKIGRNGVVLFIVLGTLLVIVFLAGAILKVVSNQSRLTYHQVSRIKAYYVTKGMMNYVLDKMRTDSAWQPSVTDIKYACYRGCIDDGVTATVGLDMPDLDSDISYKVQVTIYRRGAQGKVDIKTDYSRSPMAR